MEILPNPRPVKFLEDDRVVLFWRYGTLGDTIDEHIPATYASEASAQGTVDFLTSCVEGAKVQGPENARLEVRDVTHAELGHGVAYWHYDGNGVLWHHYEIYPVS